MKKNFFKFGLEYILATLALVSWGVNQLPVKSLSNNSSHNRYISYLLTHPERNTNLVQQLRTKQVQIIPEKEGLIAAAHAVTVAPLIAMGTTQLVDDQIKSRNSRLPLTAEGVLQKPIIGAQEGGMKRDIQEYTVKNGDSIAKIAGAFGVSMQTILYENKLRPNDYIRSGQVLKILPTTGLTHIMKPGETLSGLAAKYKVHLESILEFNEIEVPEDIEAGEVIIIPDGKIEIPPAAKPKIAQYNYIDVKRATIPDDFVGAIGSLIWPLPKSMSTTQGFSARHRGVDLSNGERPQFWAAQDGIVETSGWHGGYGNSIVINHGNGLRTRYAHASELYVTAGDQVSKGQVIGRVGNTGRVYGRTGNHLHFEVIRGETKVNPTTLAK